jgi:hypothetical protein
MVLLMKLQENYGYLIPPSGETLDGLRVRKVFRVCKVLWAHKDSKAVRVLKVRKVKQDHRVYKEGRVLKDF